MTFQSVAVLRKIKALTKRGEDPLYLDQSRKVIAAYPIGEPSFQYNEYENEIIGILNHLDAQGDIEIIDHTQMAFRLTHKGQHPHQFRAMVVIPAFVSLVVSLLTSLLSGPLLSKLLQLLVSLSNSS